MRVLVTGASGFIGAALVEALVADGVAVRAAHRTLPQERTIADRIAVGEIGAATDWSRALEDVDAVVHLAGPAHGRHGEEALRSAIVEGSAALAAQAEIAGVTRFVFMSSIKAAAERTTKPITETDPPTPGSAYGAAKLEAERRILAHQQLSPVALRPPLVHGAGAKANFARLMRLADTPAPLPFAGIANKRSVIALTSLIAAVRTVLGEPDGATGVFNVADRPACSMAEIVTALRRGLGRAPNLFNSSALAGTLPATLTESLEADDAAFRAAYGYGADIDAREALALTAQAWKARR